MTFTNEQKPCLWDKKYVIDNLPTWIYSDHAEPTSLAECKAKISSTEYTIKDIELQIEVRELELQTGSSRHSSNFDFQKWKTQALRAKQTHLYMLNAYTYWLLLNERKNNEKARLDRVINLLIEDPEDFFEQLKELL